MGKTSKYSAHLTLTLVRIDKKTPAGATSCKYSDCKYLRQRVESGEIFKQSELRKIYREL